MRFPYFIFNPLNSAGLAQRWSEFCRYAVCRADSAPPARRPLEPAFEYVTLLCRSDLALARQSLLSLLARLRSYPRIVIGYDESLGPQELTDAFGPLGIEMIHFSRPEIAGYHRDRGDHLLAAFCERDLFGSKLGLNLMRADGGRCIYADCDVLWFRSCTRLMEKYAEHPVYASVDAGVYPYDHNLMGFIRQQWQSEFLVPPHGNAGVCIFNSARGLRSELEPLLNWLSNERSIHRLAEQTIVSCLAKRHAAFISPQDVQMNWDWQRPTVSFRRKPWTARHYAGPSRPQAWVDAFGLRFGGIGLG